MSAAPQISSVLTLRDYQSAAIERYYASGKRRVMLCGPTGMGKTITAAQLILDALAAGKRVLFLAHRKELLKQPFCTLLRGGVPHQAIGIVKAGVSGGGVQLPFPSVEAASPNTLWRSLARRRPPAPVQIASVDTLRSRKLPKADLVIVDEAHRALAKSYRRILEAYPEAQIVGLTATPVRTDGKGLDAMFDELIVVATYRELVEQGYLMAPRVFSARRSPDLSRVRVVAGEYNAEQLEGVMLDDGLMGDVVEHWLEHGNGAPTLGFAVSIEHSKRLAQRFVDAGIAASHVDGNDDDDARERAFEDLIRGRVKVLFNVDIASEGTDLPLVKTVISCRPTKSLRVWLQQCGRGSRPLFCGACSELLTVGMSLCDECGQQNPFTHHAFVILDHAANADAHGRPQNDREWTLEGRKRRPRAAGPMGWKCVCGCFNDLGTFECEDCGAARPVPDRRLPRELKGKLVEVRDLDERDMRELWDRTIVEWRAYNSKPSNKPRKPAWCLFRFKERYGQPPPAGCRLPEWTADEARRRDQWDAFEAQHGAGFAAVRMKADYPAGEFLPPVTTRWV